VARPLRIEYPGACYHVVNRGNQRDRVFFSPAHYELFLEKLIAFSEQFRIGIRCYCIMPNHFHLYLRTSEANLSRFMQSLLTSFCYSLNRLRGKSGHIFQGRFKCHLVEDAAYSLAVSRYIHLNPVRTREAAGQSFETKKSMLESFKWSSHAAYVGREEIPDWLDAAAVLEKFDVRSRILRQKVYCDYVEEGLLKDTGNPFGSAISQAILGGEEFAERIKRRYLLNLNVTDPKGQRELAKMKSSFAFEEITSAVARNFNVAPDTLMLKASRSEARKAVMYLAARYCRSRMSLTEIARRMSITQSGLVRTKNRFLSELKSNKSLDNKLRGIEEGLLSIAGV
jgi:REP element-mobilizing transposase RayT